MSSRVPFAAVLMLCLVDTAAWAQEPPASLQKSTVNPSRLARAPKSPAAKPDSPSLEFTMEYIQDKLISRGVLNYEVNVHDSAAPKDWSYQFTDKLSGTYANPSSCQIGYHWKQTRSGQVVTDKEMYFDLSTAVKPEVLRMDQYLAQVALNAGHSSWTTTVTPSLFVLRISKPDNQESNFLFPDADVATHLAKAMVHAVELCASAQSTPAPADSKEPF